MRSSALLQKAEQLSNDPRVSSQSDDSIYDLYTIPKDAGESTSSTKTLVASEGSRLFDLNTA
ncbi:unnamed protein product, partial [Rotaria sp. Silwood1]